MVRLRLTKEAEDALQQVIKEYREIYMLLGDTGCCGYSNVFLTSIPPESSYEYLGEDKGVKVYVHPLFKRAINPESINIDAVKVEVDDSFSLETNLGYRLILKPTTVVKL